MAPVPQMPTGLPPCHLLVRVRDFLPTRSWQEGPQGKKIDLPNPTYFFHGPATGIARSWLRLWRYRLFLHRATFQAEAILLRLMHTHVRVRLREQLRQLWAREILCRRAAEAGVSEDFHKRARTGPLEPLIAAAWTWYEPLMFSRLLGPKRRKLSCR